MKSQSREIPDSGWRKKIHEVIFEADTFAGKLFDMILICVIIVSVIVVVIDSVNSYQERFGVILFAAEWFFTILFTIEYILRLMSVKRPLRYALSFYGIIDLLAILPTFASLFVPGVQYLLTVRIFRLLRIFRVLKLTEYLSEAEVLSKALRASARKIGIFVFTVLTLVTIIGSVMYVIEGEENGFRDIPTGIYWAIVTLTTVGYGDVSPVTPLGRFFASAVMIMGYGIIAVPTGIVTVELSKLSTTHSPHACPGCSAEPHDNDAVHCKYCGEHL